MRLYKQLRHYRLAPFHPPIRKFEGDRYDELAFNIVLGENPTCFCWNESELIQHRPSDTDKHRLQALKTFRKPNKSDALFPLEQRLAIFNKEVRNS